MTSARIAMTSARIAHSIPIGPWSDGEVDGWRGGGKVRGRWNEGERESEKEKAHRIKKEGKEGDGDGGGGVIMMTATCCG